MDIHKNQSLKPYNTFGLDVCAAYFVIIQSIDDFKELAKSEVFTKNKVLFLGGGSNLLFTGDFDGLVVKNELKGIDIIEENEEYVIIRSGAGEQWHDLVLFSLERGLFGLENLSLIPGTVGAAPMQNIGAYGTEIRDVFVELECFDAKTGEKRTFNKSDCQFGYRDSIFKNSLKGSVFINSVTLKLQKKGPVNTSYGAIRETLSSWKITDPTPVDVSRAVIAIRQSKLPDPAEIGNGGSFFKNPVITSSLFKALKEKWSELPGYNDGDHIKIPAAWLIEDCGWKGKRIGDIGVHEKQALVLVNYGDGDGAALAVLAQQIRDSVRVKFNIDLTPEVNII